MASLNCGIDLDRRFLMNARKLFAGLLFASVLAASSAAQAGIVLDGREYPDSEEADLRASCAGLQAQANTSLTSEVPDDVYSGDPASAYQLSRLTFTLRDCREAGLV
jgi:hypothetical protein